MSSNLRIFEQSHQKKKKGGKCVKYASTHAVFKSSVCSRFFISMRFIFSEFCYGIKFKFEKMKNREIKMDKWKNGKMEKWKSINLELFKNS